MTTSDVLTLNVDPATAHVEGRGNMNADQGRNVLLVIAREDGDRVAKHFGNGYAERDFTVIAGPTIYGHCRIVEMTPEHCKVAYLERAALDAARKGTP